MAAGVSRAERRERVFDAAKPLAAERPSLFENTKALRLLIETNLAVFDAVVKDFGMGKVEGALDFLISNGAFASVRNRSAPPERKEGSHSQTPTGDPAAACVKKRASKAKLSAEIFFDHQVEHALLVAIQQILEEACYTFAQKHLPDLLRSKSWTCPEAVELNRWIEVLPATFINLPSEAHAFHDAAELQSALTQTIGIRNAAVHRERRSAHDLVRMVDTARVLLRGLRDRDQGSVVDELGESLNAATKALALAKENLSQHSEERLMQIKERKRLLDAEEQAVRKEMSVEEARLTSAASKPLKDAFFGGRLKPSLTCGRGRHEHNGIEAPVKDSEPPMGVMLPHDAFM